MAEWETAPVVDGPSWETAPVVGGESIAKARKPQTSVLGAIASGAGQGALGIGDELGAGLQALFAGTTGADIYGVADTYRQARSENRQLRDASWDEHPWAYAGGYVPGLVGSMAVPVSRLASLAGKGTSLGRMALRSGLQGAEQGTVAAIGNSEADLTRSDWAGQLRDMALGGGGGLIFGGALAPAVRLGEYVAPKVAKFAYRRAVKAAGPMLKDIRALQAGGRLESVGKKLMDMGLIPTGAGVEQIANAVEQAAGTRGADVHTILGELDALTAPAGESSAAQAAFGLRRALPAQTAQNGLTQLPPALEGRPIGSFPGGDEVLGTLNQRMPSLAPSANELPGFNPFQVGARARAELLEPLRDQPALQSLIPGLEEHIRNLEALGNRRLAFTRANDVKRGYDQLLKWDKEQTPAKELLKQLRGLVNQEIESTADAAATAAGAEGLLGRFRSAKHDYRDLLQVGDFARDQVARREANRFVSPSDYGMGIASVLAGIASGHHTLGALMGVAGAGANKLARERGSSIAANSALGLSNLLANPGRAGTWAGRALTSLPGRRPDATRTLLDLLAPSMLGQNAPLSQGNAALQELGR